MLAISLLLNDPMRYRVFCLLCALFSSPSWAARPFVTDDARLTSASSCQLETWTRIYADSTELWALPACNPTGNFEITLGAGTAKTDGGATTHDYVLQFKTLFKPLETNGYGVGFGIGTVNHPDIKPGPNQLGNTYAYVPISISFNNDQTVMHGNLGWLRDRASGKNNMTYGVGGEFRVAPQFTAITELFGDNRSAPFMQVGLRYAVIPELFQIDTTFGQQITSGSGSQWLSVGIRLTPDHLF